MPARPPPLPLPAVASRLESSVNINWGTGSPVPSVVNSDYFAARFTFYLQVRDGPYATNPNPRSRNPRPGCAA